MPVFTSDDHPLATVVLRDFVDKTLIHRYQELSTSDLWIPCAIESNTSTDLNKWLFLIVFM